MRASESLIGILPRIPTTAISRSGLAYPRGRLPLTGAPGLALGVSVLPTAPALEVSKRSSEMTGNGHIGLASGPRNMSGYPVQGRRRMRDPLLTIVLDF